MNRLNRTKSHAMLAAFLLSFGIFVGQTHAEPKLDKVHFLIPGGAGGGWDGTARGVGQALTQSKLIKHASYQNMSGGGGGKAMAYLIKTAKRQRQTLMVNSTPLLIRSLQKVFPHSFRDFTPIAAVIADYGVFAVRQDSAFKNWQDVVTVFQTNPRQLSVGGGSGRGSMDHLVAAMAFQAAGVNPKSVRYIPYDAGGKALAGLLSGETEVLSTGLGEALEQHKAGQVRILAITAEKRSAAAPDIPTLKELGYDVTFVNWRGFFGPPGLDDETVTMYTQVFEKMYQATAWEQVRERNGWADLYKPGAEFYAFLEEQEKTIGELLKALGFLQ
ncbi:MAG: tripartite tricarboxylate transporter substrate-binding protein [Candidatus Poribacteria bacterium]|nr:tripartite tricarboxylate transporter substrate-binding protein [Candidatus Poribacteria bacterium]